MGIHNTRTQLVCMCACTFDEPLCDLVPLWGQSCSECELVAGLEDTVVDSNLVAQLRGGGNLSYMY